MKIGVIAGGGDLPHAVIAGAKESGHDVSIFLVDGFADPSDFPNGAEAYSLAELGKMTRALRKQDCTHVCFVGNVKRPNFRTLRPDLKGLTKLPGAVLAAKNGDNALLSYLLETYEKEGFQILSPQELCQSLLLPAGHLGDVHLSKAHRDDTEKACKIAHAIGALDIGQGAVVCRGLILAVEAQEGTDLMLQRVAQLPQEIRGNSQEREGVLAKMVKPGQEARVDLPTIGPKTIRLVAEAGLAGIVAEGHQAFVIDRDAVIAAANAAGVFVVGLPPIAT